MRTLLSIALGTAGLALLLLLLAAPSTSAQAEHHESDALLDIARDYRDGGKNVPRSPVRAARFYEFLIDRKPETQLLHLAELELAELLEVDVTLSSRYSYLSLLMRAADGGDMHAQHKLSVIYGTGVAARDLAPMNSGRALFLEYMAALSGHPLANMGMGYRYMQGIGVTQSCEAALPFYEVAANHAAEAIQKRGGAPQPDLLRLSEANDPTKKWLKRDGHQELADYYSHLAEQGDTMAALTLGNMLLLGTRMTPRNETRALHYLNLAADNHHPAGSGLLGLTLLKQYIRSASNPQVDDPEQSQVAPKVDANQLGRGFGFSPHNAMMERANAELVTVRIIKLLRFSSQKGDVNGVVGMGLAYFHGIGLPRNITKAVELLQKALGTHVDAGYYLGEICMGLRAADVTWHAHSDKKASGSGASSSSSGDSGRRVQESAQSEVAAIGLALQEKSIDPSAALRFYTQSAQMGNVLAQHRLAHMYKRGLGGQQSCQQAVHVLKNVAERGDWMAALTRAHTHYAEGRRMAALHAFAQLAAVGVESAQYNAAYVLTKMSEMGARGGFSLSPFSESAFFLDPLERQNRQSSSDEGGTADLRKLLADLEKRAEEVEVEAGAGATGAKAAQPASASATASAVSASETSSLAYLGAADWREFLSRYQPAVLAPPELGGAHKGGGSVDSGVSEADRRKVEFEARALTLFDLSAAQGNAEAFVQLGDFYYYGRAGLLQREAKRQAADFYQKAADLRHTRAIFNLGIIYQVGWA
ncbi:hypothetical protein B484DRAFT_158144 [Ochromonadaceae sp. CCMP2298]|nr:hypothetical protein B484DRAFT_158144 [Ochromonadaceae sp. CCMP2298]